MALDPQNAPGAGGDGSDESPIVLPPDILETLPASPAGVESARAAETKLRYAQMSQPRSLERLAREIRADQFTQLQAYLAMYPPSETPRADAALGKTPRDVPPPPVVQKVETIARQLKRWSGRHGWQEYVKAYDRAVGQLRLRAKEQRLRTVLSDQERLSRGVYRLSARRLTDMMRADTEAQAIYDARFKAAQALVTRLLEANKVEEALAVEIPRPPKPLVSSFTLSNILEMGMEREMLSVLGGLEAGTTEEKQSMPEVVEITQTTAPPPEPADPYADRAPLSATVASPGAAGSATGPSLPTGLIRLTSTPPQPPRGLGDDDDDDDYDEEDDDE